ncbi:MAG: cyclic nucleotide-binding domain-containing protein [Anaerolineales bacterium]|nr:cyclic nucleotide-binding domain-containing protein [Anaerolineales bacterium]
MTNEKKEFNLEVLRRSPFFASFSEKQLILISEIATNIYVQADTIIFRQGENSAAMYLILHGKVKIVWEDEDGEKIHSTVLKEHQVFGENAVLSTGLCRDQATAVTDSELLVIDRESIMEIVRKLNPEEVVEFFSAWSEQIHAVNRSEFERILAQRILASQMEVEKQRALTEMVASLAHEINTPLGVINTAVNIMARELASPKEVTLQRAADIAESLELMQRNVERAHKLVQDFKKISVSQLIDEKELFDISEAVEENVNLMLVSLKRSQIGVNYVNRLSFEHKNWMGYRGVLSQILINLLTNAERHAYPNGTGGYVDVTIELADDKHYRLTVQDYGRGIPAENQPHIFEPFFTTARSNGGTGLGLAIVHNLVTKVLKGEIFLRAGLIKGTSFQVVFPRVLPE